jgi:hypothetical protein
MPLVKGREIKIKDGQPERIQAKINVIDDLPADLKSEIDPIKYARDDYFGQELSSNEDGFSLFEKDSEENVHRKVRYEYFREMDTNEFIHRALEIVADDSTQNNPEGDAVKIYSDDEQIKEKLEDIFYDKLDMNNEIWTIMFETAKMGDIVVDDYKKPKEVIALVYREPDKMERIEVNGKLSHFVYRTQAIEDENRISMRFNTPNQQEEKIYKLQPWQVIHFKLENKSFSPYGASLLYPGLKTYRRLNLLEDVMLVYRLSRAPERRVFYIDVGNLNRVEAKRFLEKVKNQYRTSSFIDEDGKINKKARMLSITSDIFVPVREGGTGTRIETLQGGEALHNIDDMKYFRDKILRTMNIPPAYLGDEADRSRGTLSQLDIKFSRFIERIQDQVIRGLNKIAALELFFAGFKKDKLSDFDIELTAPSNIKEITEIDMMNQRMGLLGTIQALNIFSDTWMLKNILKLSDAEIADIKLYKTIENQERPPEEGEIPAAGGAAAAMPGAEVPPGEAGLPPEGGATMPATPGAPGIETPAEAPIAPAPETPEEIAASTMVHILGQDFILEHQKDFFDIIKYINENKEKKDEPIILSELIEDISELFESSRKKSRPRANTNNVTKQLLTNELGGLVFENGKNKERTMKLWEGYIGKTKGKEALKYRVRTSTPIKVLSE